MYTQTFDIDKVFKFKSPQNKPHKVTNKARNSNTIVKLIKN